MVVVVQFAKTTIKSHKNCFFSTLPVALVLALVVALVLALVAANNSGLVLVLVVA